MLFLSRPRPGKRLAARDAIDDASYADLTDAFLQLEIMGTRQINMFKNILRKN